MIARTRGVWSMDYHRDGNAWRVDVGPFRIEIVPAATGWRADYGMNGTEVPGWRRLGFYDDEDQAKREAPKALAVILRGVVERLEEP